MRRQRLLAALAVALLCAPGTWLRSEVVRSVPKQIDIAHIAGPAPTGTPGWHRAGVWAFNADRERFGGFSALITLGPGNLRAFSDRGYRFTLTEPGLPDGTRRLNRQFVAPGREWKLWDIEAATRAPDTGHYWLAYEQTHLIHRFTIASKADGVRDLTGTVKWPVNSGIEAMVRLADGQFVILPEGRSSGLIFAGDPVEGGKPAAFAFTSPAKGYAVTDLAQLPDGRLLVLMRDLVRPSSSAWPPFSGLLAIGPAPTAGGAFAPEVALRLDGVLPRDNYEGLAVRPRDDGRLDVWVMADNNFSVFQRNLLARLVFDPAASATDPASTKKRPE
jgi:hypothetical protein